MHLPFIIFNLTFEFIYLISRVKGSICFLTCMWEIIWDFAEMSMLIVFILFSVNSSIPLRSLHLYFTHWFFMCLFTRQEGLWVIFNKEFNFVFCVLLLSDKLSKHRWQPSLQIAFPQTFFVVFFFLHQPVTWLVSFFIFHLFNATFWKRHFILLPSLSVKTVSTNLGCMHPVAEV